HLVGVWPSGTCDQPAARHLADPVSLGRVQRLEGLAAVGGHASGLDLTERQGPAVERNDVELTPASPVVALDDLKSEPDEVLCGELLAELTEASAGVCGHPTDATPGRVTGGTRRATTLRMRARGACAKLRHDVTHVSRRRA